MKNALLILSILFIGTSFAQTTATWTGSSSTDWSTASNWTPASIPGASSAVVIGSATNQPLLASNATIASLTLTSSSVLELGTYTITVSGATITTSAQINNGHIIGASFTTTSSTFGAKTTFIGSIIQVRNSTFNAKSILTQNGSTQTLNYGNTFNSPVELTNTATQAFIFGYTSADVFNDSLKATVNGSYDLILAHSSTGNMFNGYCNFIKDASANNRGVVIGKPTSSATFKSAVKITSLAASTSTVDGVVFTNCTFDSTSSLSTDNNAFTRGTLLFSNCSVNIPLNITLQEQARLELRGGTIFHKECEFTAPILMLRGFTNNDVLSITKTGSTTDLSTGPITSNGEFTLINVGAGYLYIGNGLSENQFNSNLTLENTGGGTLLITLTEANTYLTGDLTLRNTSGTLRVGSAGTTNKPTLSGNLHIRQMAGTCVFAGIKLDAGKQIYTDTLSGGTFLIADVVQLGTQTLNLNGNSTARISITSGCDFGGNFTVTAPSIFFSNATFRSDLALTKTGNIIDQCDGNLTIHGTSLFKNTSSGGTFQLCYPANSMIYHGDVTFENAGTGNLWMGYAGIHYAKADVIFAGSNSLATSWNHKLVLNGTGTQAIKRSNTLANGVIRLEINKASGEANLEMPFPVILDLNLAKGILKTTETNILSLNTSCTLTGGSDSSYVEGPMTKVGTSAFTFPVGGDGVYAPLGIDAVASATTFKAKYIAGVPDTSYSRSTKDTTIGFVNRCGYWNLDRTTGSQNAVPTLGWSNNPCYSTAPVDASIALWDGSTWKDKGNAAYSGTSTAGNVKSNSAITSYPAVLNLGGVCSFFPELTTNLDTLVDGYLGFVQASPENQLNYKFLNNGIEVQNGVESYYSSSTFNNADSVSVVVTNMDGCDGSASLLIVESANEAYIPVTELVFDWASKDGTQEFFLNHKTLVKTDVLGNVYKAGSTLNENGDYDILVCKYDSNGVNLWCEQYGGAANGMDVVGDIELDNNASLFVCGSSVEVVADSNDVIILKYLSNGTLAWSSHFNGAGDGADAGVDISFNELTNKVIVSGITTGTLAPLTDFLTMQLDTNGNILWNKVYDNGLFDIATGHSGSSGDTITVAGVTQTGITDFSFLSVTYNPSGDTISTSIAASDSINFYKLRDVKFASNGNIYLTGSTPSGGSGRDIQTVALNSSLSVIWSSTYKSAASYNDEGKALTFDDNGNVYVTGYSQTAENGTDARLLKYNASGSLLWAKSYNGEGSGADTANAVLIDQAGLITIAGSTFNDTNDDYFVQQYDTIGNLRYQKTWNSWSNKNDRATALAIDDAGAVVISGQSETDSTMNYTTVRYMKKQIHETNSNSQTASAGGFLENRGQLLNTNAKSETEVLYYNQFMYPSTYYKADTVSFVFSKIYADTSGNTMDSLQRVDMTFVSGTENTRYEPRGNNKSITNFYYPHIDKGRERVPTHNSLYKQNAWVNIDVEFASNQEGLAINFIVNPGAKVSNIKVKFEGQDSVFKDASGELYIQSILGEKSFDKAEAYTLYPNGQKSKLPWKPSYVVNSGQLSFVDVGSYASNLPLVIEVKKQSAQQLLVEEGNLWWSTYYGGDDGNEINMDVATDANNNSYICGRTNAVDFPKTNNLTFGDEVDFDAFLVKFSSFAERKWATLYGGSGYDSNDGIAVNKYDANATHGYTIGTSNSGDLETFNNLGSSVYYKSTISGEKDAFMTNFRFETGTFWWSSFIGGEGEDIASGITYDNFGNIYGLINTKSLNATENSCSATTSNALPLCNPGNNAYFEDQNQGDNDLFIIQFNPSKQLTWSTYFGSDEYDFGYDIHANNNPVGGLRDIYIVGKTDRVSTTFGNSSTFTSAPGNGDFPLYDDFGTDDYFQAGSNAFISKFSAQGRLTWSTNITGAESLHSLATTTDNYVIAVGIGGNNQVSACFAIDAGSNLPVCDSEGPSVLGGDNGFIAKFYSRNQLKWSTTFNAGLDYCGGAFENQTYLEEFPYIADLCPTISRKLDVTTMNNNTFFVIASNNYKNFSVNYNSSLYFDNDYYIPNSPTTGDGDPNRAYADAILMGYYPSNILFYSTYFGSPASGVENIVLAPPSWIDIGQSIASYENDVLYIAGHATSRNGFPWQFPEVDPANGIPWYKTFGGQQVPSNLNSFIARFNFDEFNWINSIETNENSDASLVVYPNPTNGIFTIDFIEDFTGSFAIYNYLGQQVQSIQSQKKIQKYQFDLSGESSGIYFLVVYSETEVNSKAYKIIKR